MRTHSPPYERGWLHVPNDSPTSRPSVLSVKVRHNGVLGRNVQEITATQKTDKRNPEGKYAEQQRVRDTEDESRKKYVTTVSVRGSGDHISKCVGLVVVAVEAKTFSTHDFVTIVCGVRKPTRDA